MTNDEEVGYALDILKDNTLYAAAPESFPDPHECRVRLDFNAPESAKIKAVRRQFGNLSDVEALKMCAERESRDHSLFHDHLRKEIGAICFFTRPDDQAMWAYYGGKHNGICIEFSAFDDDARFDFIVQAQQVGYQNDRPIVNVYTDTPVEKLKSYVYTKSKAWKHENEWRIIIDKPPPDRLIELPPGIISAVFLGAKITAENLQLVRDCVADRVAAGDLMLFEFQPAEDAYELYLGRHTATVRTVTPAPPRL